jgi:hypothetical protein
MQVFDTCNYDVSSYKYTTLVMNEWVWSNAEQQIRNIHPLIQPIHLFQFFYMPNMSETNWFIMRGLPLVSSGVFS